MPASVAEVGPVITVLQMQLAGIRSHALVGDRSGLRGDAVAAVQAWCGPDTDAADALDFVCRQISLLQGLCDELSISVRAAWRWVAVELAGIA
jgi:hypothetical protein